jgi:hypothetical protein
MSLTDFSLGGNYDVLYKLFLPRESLVSDIQAGDGNIQKIFLGCIVLIKRRVQEGLDVPGATLAVLFALHYAAYVTGADNVTCKNSLCTMYCIQHCFICRPSDSTVSEDAGIEPRTVATRHWQSYALTTRLLNTTTSAHPPKG